MIALHMLVFTPRAGRIHVISLRKANRREARRYETQTPELIDKENPEWTAADFKRARPASEVLPKLIGKKAAVRLLKPRGRPKSLDAKVSISLRLAPETLARWKASGPGWQTRMAAALSRTAPRV
ncbi:MAG: BrnA antitoxin family protein [Chromatiales bacterium]